jgi:flagellin-specific chaperone FliS
MENRLCEKCKEIIELLINEKIRFKSVVMQKIAEAYIAIKSGDLKKAEEIIKDLLIFLDL